MVSHSFICAVRKSILCMAACASSRWRVAICPHSDRREGDLDEGGGREVVGHVAPGPQHGDAVQDLHGNLGPAVDAVDEADVHGDVGTPGGHGLAHVLLELVDVAPLVGRREAVLDLHEATNRRALGRRKVPRVVAKPGAAAVLVSTPS